MIKHCMIKNHQYDSYNSLLLYYIITLLSYDLLLKIISLLIYLLIKRKLFSIFSLKKIKTKRIK